MNWRAFVAALGCCLVAVTAVAQLLSPTFPRLGSICSTYTGPLDLVPGATACYAFRACSKATACAKAPSYIGSDGSGGLLATIHVTNSGILNQTELAANVGSLFVQQMFDQTNNVLGLNILTQSGSTNPRRNWPCDVLAATTVCAETNNTGTVSWKSTPFFTPATGVVSYSIMARRDPVGATAFCPFLSENSSNQIGSQNAQTNTWELSRPSGGFILAGASDGAFHSAVGVINGESSVINIDGTETTGTVNGNTVSGLIQGLTGASGNPCWEGEAIFWDNVALSGAQRTALINNIRGFWGI